MNINEQVKRKRVAQFCIEVFGHRRNSYVPLHVTESYPGWTGTGEFKRDGKRWTEEYMLVP